MAAVSQWPRVAMAQIEPIGGAVSVWPQPLDGPHPTKVLACQFFRSCERIATQKRASDTAERGKNFGEMARVAQVRYKTGVLALKLQ